MLIGMATFWLLHVAIWRLAPSSAPRLRLLVVLAGVGMGVSVLTQRWLGDLNGTSLWTVLCAALLVMTGYLFMYAGIARSVSVTLLAWLLQRGSMNVEELAQEYLASSRFEDRLRLMQASGFVQLTQDRVMLTPRGCALTRVAARLSQLLGTTLHG